ncbi:MAG: hypothetical protein TREMPRED_004417 [Tremellales sp. Tagirdzhanova-0007]|nr:MAG: hypothetical protein TREMPRED_004417 [Tremellales sp. Tagirdzhanova-0007]
MQLGRYQVSTLRPAPILSITFSEDGRIFAVASENGYEVWRTWPLGLIRRRVLPGTLVRALPLLHSPLLVLQGGGAAPLYAPNKAVVYHDALGVAIAEIEFGERIRGIEVRSSTIVIALSQRVIAYEYGVGSSVTPSVKGKGKASDGFWLRKIREWETAENENGLIAISTAPGSTLLAMPGRQAGHVQLVLLPPCPPVSTQAPPSTSQPFRSPIILAHTHALSRLACTATGSHIVTTSERGTLIRVWDTSRGRLERELRRGMDRAEMWGVRPEDAALRDTGDVTNERMSKGGRVVGWSDKGTIHIWLDDPAASIPPSAPVRQPSLTHLLSRNLPLPKYFSSTASSAQYHLPRKNPHAFSAYMNNEGEANELAERFVVGWVEVESDVDPDEPNSEINLEDKKGANRLSGVPIGMGSREERRSFGSDVTSRTATSTSRAETPTLGSQRQSLGRAGHARPTSEKIPRGKAASGGTPWKKKKIERQLVAITYSGGWYRLRLPDQNVQGDSEGNKSVKCELAEYRRLGVGGDGW